MSAHDFSAALEAPDNHGSRRQLQLLASQTPSFSTSLLDTATAYFHAFCTITHSSTKRTWIGVSLRNMIQASPQVPRRLANLSPGLSRIGDIILSPSEIEDTRIVAGLIVRECLSHNINTVTLQSFWGNNAILTLATVFPQKASSQWIKEFQSFVKVLHELLLQDETTLPNVHSPLSFATTKTGHRHGKTSPTLFVADGLLALVDLGADLRDVQLVEIPLKHITGVSEQPSRQQSEQDLRGISEPWNVILELRPGDWTYQINLSEYSETHMTIMFSKKIEAHVFLGELGKHTGLCPHQNVPASKKVFDDAFGFPEQSTRIIRPAIARNKASTNDSKFSGTIGQKDGYLITKAVSDVPATISRPNLDVEADEAQLQETVDSKLRPRRVAKESISCVEKESSDVEDLDSEHGQSREHYTHSPAQRIRSLRPAGSGSPPTVLQPEVSKERCAITQMPGIRRVPSCKRRSPELLLNSVRNKQMTTQQPKGVHPIEQSLIGLVAHSRSPTHIEASILEQLNPKMNNGSNITAQTPTLKQDVVLGKRPSGARPPSTPSKRARREHARDVDGTCKASDPAPSTNKRCRILEDPTSPCGQRYRASTNLVHNERHVDMQPPSNPRINHGTQPSPSLPQDSSINSSNFEFDRKQTPVHHAKWSRSGENVTELLSSNSKPTPASPHAESTAISGHASPRRVRMEKEMADSDIRRTDPFKQSTSRKIRPTTFTRRLSRAMNGTMTPNSKSKDRGPSDMHLDGNTLVEHEEEPLPMIKDIPTQMPSSPPSLAHDSPSTPGSSSLGEADSKQNTPVSVFDTEGVEWEANLQPHQRTLRERLFRVSNRVIRHIVDNETIVEDIADTYHEDGELLLQTLIDRHSTEIDTMSKQMNHKADKMKRSCDQLLKQLARERTVAEKSIPEE